MKYLLTILLVVASSWTDLDKIAKVNKLKKEAKTAYNNGNYQKALDNYLYLVDSMQVEDDNIMLNMANAYYKLKDTTNAVNNYQSVVDSKDNIIRSVAQQQLGVIANRSKKFKEALEHFKEALKADPANEEARYNYELLKKVLKEQEEQNKDQKNQDKQDQENQDQQKKDQQKKDQQKQEQQKKEDQEQQQDQEKEGKGDEKEDQEQQDKKDGEKKEDGKPKEEEKQKPEDGEESDEKNKDKQDQMSSASDKLQEMKISEEKAKMILEALKNKEIQYYQQNKRKATKPRESDKPDW
ncbi:hypothetical protein JMN32_22930 [Fulvivirga sp. 29W222]|uniref:Tetratricopeptide repeat protein n=1 Tax=Fulvivirga marina TaxID=2494733 RepID=A0A937G1Y3_9BACT|nr:hypothetical protein [Fulvivirga marina]MBL6449182.1 hypothetical protein [Fulvivirga marina]